jgi:hypothetical protein
MAQQYNKELNQQNFTNQLNLAAGRSGQLGGMAGAKDAQAGRTADMWAGVGRGAGTAAASYFGSKSKDGEDFDDFE